MVRIPNGEKCTVSLYDFKKTKISKMCSSHAQPECQGTNTDTFTDTVVMEDLCEYDARFI